MFRTLRSMMDSKLELLDHAQGDGATTGFGVVQLALKQPGADPSFGQNFGCARSARTSTDDGNSQHLSPLRWIINLKATTAECGSAA